MLCNILLKHANLSVSMLGCCRRALLVLDSPEQLNKSDLHTTFAKKGQHLFKMKSKKLKQRQQGFVDRINLSNQYEILSDMVTPHWKIPYEEELAIKQNLCNEVLEEILLKVSPNSLMDDGKKLVADGIIPSPVRDNYRNKDEFSVWPGLDGDPKTVGFFVGSPVVGKVVCVPPTKLKCIKESHKEIARLYEKLMRLSPLPASYQLHDNGFWRNLIVRSNEAGDHLALIITNPGDYSAEQVAEQQDIMRQYFAQHAPALALFHQSCGHVRCSRLQAPIQHLSGRPHLREVLGGKELRVSPDSFVQSNKAAAELLYDVVLNMARPRHYSTLLDLYCGAGVLSLLASERVRGCVGVELVPTAVEDAEFNAQLNKVTNCKFVAGAVEVKLARVLRSLEYSSDIVAVLNPGRGGAVEGVISLLRQNPNVSRVVYVSCKPDNPLTMKNFVQLCERVSRKVKPFRLVQASPIDLFPYTSHYELALCFSRT